MRNTLILLSILAATAGLMECLGFGGSQFNDVCIGLVFIFLALILVMLIVSLGEPQFGKMIPGEKYHLSNLNKATLRR